MVIAVKKLLYSPLANRLSGFVLGTAWAVFAWFNMKAFLTTGMYAFLLFCISESLQALFFIIRKEPKTVSTDGMAWASAFGGTFAVLNLRPGGAVLWDGGATIVTVSFVFQIIALLSLNTSFAIAPANRGIKTTMGYRLIRHPIYATYVLSTVGYLLFNATLYNACWVALFYGLTYLRIRAEEQHLSEDESYRAYMKKVPYRIIPFVW